MCVCVCVCGMCEPYRVANIGEDRKKFGVAGICVCVCVLGGGRRGGVCVCACVRVCVCVCVCVRVCVVCVVFLSPFGCFAFV